MTLTDLAALASILSSLAVAASLVYLGLQTHQNVKHTRALIQQGRASISSTNNIAMADADLVAAMIVSDGGMPTPEGIKRAQSRYIYNAVFAGMGDTFYQHSSGLLIEDQFDSFRAGVVNAMRSSGMREYWNKWKAARPDTNVKFKAFIDECISKVPTVTPPTPPSQ